MLEYKPGIVMYAKFIDGEYILPYVFYCDISFILLEALYVCDG